MLRSGRGASASRWRCRHIRTTTLNRLRRSKDELVETRRITRLVLSPLIFGGPLESLLIPRTSNLPRNTIITARLALVTLELQITHHSISENRVSCSGYSYPFTLAGPAARAGLCLTFHNCHYMREKAKMRKAPRGLLPT